MKRLDIEWSDGSCATYELEEGITRYELMRWLSRQERSDTELVSAWIDLEPWWGLCTADHLP